MEHAFILIVEPKYVSVLSIVLAFYTAYVIECACI